MSTRSLLAVLAAASLVAVSACGDASGGGSPSADGAEPGADGARAAVEEINSWEVPTAVSEWTLMTNDELLAMGKADEYTKVAGLDMLRLIDSMPGSKDDGFDVYGALAAEKQENDASFNADNAIMGDVYAVAEVHVAIYKYAGDPRRGAYLFRSSEPRMAPDKGTAGCDELFSGAGIRCTRMEDGLQWMFIARVSEDGPTADETLDFINDFLATQGSPPFTETWSR